MSVLIAFLVAHAGTLLPLAYELAARLIPSKRNMSIVDLAYKAISAVIPNNLTDGQNNTPPPAK